MSDVPAIYNSSGKVTASLLRAELLSIASMVVPGSIGPVLRRLEALAIELHHYNELAKREHVEREVSNV